MTFQALELSPALLKALEKEQYTTPTPIQAQAIPPALAGRDLLGIAQTGTGKTAAFALPVLQNLAQRSQPVSRRSRRVIRALILTPTRELALQIHTSFQSYGLFTPLRAHVIYGGVSQKPQEMALRNGVDILVATPGRLKDLMNQGLVDLSHIEILTLDEADRMLDMGFIHDVRHIIGCTPRKRQTLFFSATMPPDIVTLSRDLLQDPARIAITPDKPTVEKIVQSLYHVDKASKRDLLRYLLQDPHIDSALVFTRTKHGADRVARELNRHNIQALAIHGNKSQQARQKALQQFKDRTVRVLVATDIAARGLDIEELSHVVNFDLPEVPETYIHRIGRTGRAGLAGEAFSFCDADELKLLKDIERLCGRSIKKIDHPYPFTPHVYENKENKELLPRRSGSRPVQRNRTKRSDHPAHRDRNRIQPLA